MDRRRQIEVDVAGAMVRILKEMTGRGPTEAVAHVFQDMVIVRLKGTLTREEQFLARELEGRRLLKQVRAYLREQFSLQMQQSIENITGARVTSSHHDISTRTGEAIEVFILDRVLAEEMPPPAADSEKF
ncbi:DUF2294 domain-containing protein [Gloeobacter kilaueensis]|uniref:Na+-translocating membrane potential-generating system MpsC domain-containing protein n=1 Tax=Gloeobacter kilaueensis (strain ATCC BAA-2537 / CCAP 1431/1 / ULC 316 / JS1) TaxID=1183438 RepID=U5QM10_GLOK1|nr:DUF2294 domain-containing protein [Gloeobacter kilaueensis]AGY59903.1 hypothetical protein GKIL_3657 [Gloeobacter kilaueensis JS1]